MTAQAVDAVFFWRATGVSVFKAAYGRKPRDEERNTYTKDFHQPRNDLARALEVALGIEYGGDTKVEWRWPGGSYPDGRLKPAADFATSGGRMNLRWETDSAPPPWRLTPQPTETTLETLQGTPDLDTETAANAQLEALKASGEQPWLLAVHLSGEGPVLHARVVLENPQPGREFASWDTLPSVVRTAMQNLPASRPGGHYTFAGGPATPTSDLVTRILNAFKDSPNVLLVGPPGTGKTVAMEEILRLYAPGTTTESVTFKPEVLHGAFGVQSIADAGEPRSHSVVFHPSYTYENFVMGLLPAIDPAGAVDDRGGVYLKAQVGPLLELAHFASTPGRRALLVLDEFNRGNASAIFGDTLSLLDADKRATPGDATSGTHIATPYAHMRPSTDDGEDLAQEVGLPSSLRILAAMNSADRSVAPLDAALRRRFAIIHVDPDIALLRQHLGASTGDGFVLATPTTWTSAGHIAEVAAVLLEGFNRRIEFILGRDFLLGQSVFWHVTETDDRNAALSRLAVALDNRVMGTLSLTFTDDDEALAAVLNVSDSTTSSAAAAWEHAPTGLSRWPNRLRLTRFQDLDESDLVACILSLIDLPATGGQASGDAALEPDDEGEPDDASEN